MSSRERVRKYRAVRKARMEEIQKVATICATELNTSNNIEVDTEDDTCEQDGLDIAIQEEAEKIHDSIHEDGSDIVVQEEAEDIEPTIQDHVSMDNIHRLQPNMLTENQPGTEEIERTKNKYSKIEELRLWAVESNLQHNHLDKLLQQLRTNWNLDLPRSSKTFLGTAGAEYEIVEMANDNIMKTSGQFVYLGMEKILKQTINSKFHRENIQLLINIDGMPLSASGSKSFWPIICKVYYHPDVYKPFPVAIYFGKGKPYYLNEYLEQFINEINHLQEDGIIIDECNYKVELKAFVADTPARAYLKCTKGHGGYNACERCTVHGELVKVGNGSTIIYPGTGHEERTNMSFITQEDSQHHTGTSPLLYIKPQLDLSKIFVLDHMHLFFNGVMKKLFQLWLSGPLKVRLSLTQKIEISQRLLRLRVQVPAEFQRKPRPISEYLKWKATEFRYFLLYCGPIVMKNILPSHLYDHFLLLHVACRILCSEELALTYNDLAKKYLDRFVRALQYLYDARSLVINMHNLLHVADDVINFNCPLSRISCFPFENALGKIKRTLRTPNKPLSQLCRRFHEQSGLLYKKADLPLNEILTTRTKNGQVRMKAVRWNSMIIICKRPDNMVRLKNNIIMEILTLHGKDNSVSTIEIEGKVWQTSKLVYSYPCKSSLLKTWELSPTSQGVARYPLTFVTHKLVRLPRKQNVLCVMPLLHS